MANRQRSANLLYLFIKDLIVHGGIKVETLSHRTLVDYTGIYTKLPSPLSYLDASDPVKLDAWAKQAFETQESKAYQWLVYNFLRFISHVALTDHLNIHQFDCPTLPMSVDAYRLSTEQVHYAVHQLVDTVKGTPLQRLFSAVALLLGYYGALRRGEIVRLRIQDVVVISAHKHQFRLHITETPEGKTKNGQSRYVYVVMPSASANLCWLCLKSNRPALKTRPCLVYRRVILLTIASLSLSRNASLKGAVWQPGSLSSFASLGRTSTVSARVESGVWLL